MTEGYPPQNMQENMAQLPVGIRYRLTGLAERAIREAGWIMEDKKGDLEPAPGPFELLAHPKLQGLEAVENAQAEIIQACASVSEQTNPN